MVKFGIPRILKKRKKRKEQRINQDLTLTENGSGWNIRKIT